MQHGEARRWHLPLLHSWGGLTTTACKLARFLPPSWIVGEVLALLVLWFMLYLQVCSPAVPLLSSLPSTTKTFMAVKPIFSSFAFTVFEWHRVFLSGQGHTILFKNKFVVFKCSKWLEMLNFQLLQDAARSLQGHPCAAPLSCHGDTGAGQCNLDPKTYLVISYKQQYLQGTDPLFSSCLFL